MEAQRKRRKTLNLKQLKKIVKNKLGAGLEGRLIEKAVEQTFVEVFRALSEGKNVKIGNFLLRAKLVQTPIERKVRNPRTGEEMVKVINPHLSISVKPKRIEFDKVQEVLNI